MIALLTILLACGPKQLEPSPTAKTQAQSIFEKHVRAIGGETAMLRHKSARIEGKIRRMDVQQEYRFITVKAAPDQMRTTVKTINGENAIQRGTDGRVYWLWSNGQYRKATQEEKAAIRRHADFYSELNMVRQYPRVSDQTSVWWKRLLRRFNQE